MQPTPNQVHVNAILTNISVAYIQSADAFVSTKVFPVVPVGKQSNVYFTYTKNDWFRDEAQQRAPGTESAGSGYGLSTASYTADVFAFHKDVDNQTLNNADMPLSPATEATRFVTQRLMLRQEIQWVSDYFTTSVWTTDSTPSNLWSDYTNSDPISDIETGKRTILSTTGFLPNTLTVGYDVWIKLKNHPDIIDRIKYGAGPGNPARATRETVAQVFELDRLFVAMAIKGTNVEGETAAYSFTHGKHALLTYSTPSPSLLTPSAGYTFQWTGVSDGLGETVGVKEIPMPWIDSNRYEGQIAFDNKVVATDLGYFFNGAVA
jgi:hypothetical protein